MWGGAAYRWGDHWYDFPDNLQIQLQPEPRKQFIINLLKERDFEFFMWTQDNQL